MEARSALSSAVLLGIAVGALALGLGSPDRSAATPQIADASQALLPEAPVATQWDIPVERNESVDRFVRLFTERQTDRMALYLKRSGRYEGMIRGKLRERGMPEDLLYLSMIESGFNPTARSKAQAVGLWQFIADTGRRYGLRIDRYVDERQDPEKSTEAALSYLQDLHGEFGAWYLAAAAYNTGEGRVGRVMREVTGSVRGEEADFWRIRSRLPSETREYVPLMVAAALVAKEPARYGLDGVERHLPVSVETVGVPGGVDLAVVADAIGVSEEEIKELNPQLVRGMTPPEEIYPVRLPEGRKTAFALNFARARESYREREAVREREVKLAAATKVKAAKATAAKAPTKAKAKSSAKRTHRVKQGESLWTIARRNNTSVAAIKRANGMGKRTMIRPGQRLTIPG